MNNVNIIDDHHERELALSLNHSFIVQAPAGSGKTELLIQRFLTLLAHVRKPESILAITFTKKAASEMRQRILQALINAHDQPEPQHAHARKTWRLAKAVLHKDHEFKWNLINNPNQLRIQTIDSFCAHLSTQLPLQSHLGAAPTIDPNPTQLYKSAIRTVLSHLEHDYPWSTAIEKLLIHLDNDIEKLESLIVALLFKRDQWLAYLALAEFPEQLKEKLNHDLQHLINDFLLEADRLFNNDILDEISDIAYFSACNLIHSNIESPIAKCADIKNIPFKKNLSQWRGIAHLLLTKSFEFRKRLDEKIGFPKIASFKNQDEVDVHQLYRSKYIKLIEKIACRDDIKDYLKEIILLPSNAYSEDQWQILRALLLVLKVTIAQLNIEFHDTGKIDYIENTQAALRALGSNDQPTDLALALDLQIQHILIDEFQDTSYTQYQLLERLTLGWDSSDNRTLFVVGDPMQSIYRFREADVGLFLRMQTYGFGQINLTPIKLSVNFRSSNQIIEWNNKIFNGIFPTYSDMITGAVNFSESTSHITTRAIDSGVHLTAHCNGSIATEATEIIRVVKNALDLYPDDSIAIIVRSRSHLASIIPQLKQSNIQYNAVDIDPLSSKQHIQDLLSLTKALHQVDDTISWLSILRAPWCGLSLSDLLIISKRDSAISILEQIQTQEIRDALSTEGSTTTKWFTDIINNRILLRDRIPLRTWIENTWLILGGAGFLNNEYEIQEADVFFELLEEYSNEAGAFEIEKFSDMLSKKFINQQSAQHKLSIMTIHAAKGLEFDTVILPQLHRKNPNDDKSLFLWLERPLLNNQVITLLAPLENSQHDKDTLYEYIMRQRKLKAYFEVDRLLYVAATRAKKRLQLSFILNYDTSNDIRIEPNSFLAKLWPSIKHDTHLVMQQTPASNQEEQLETLAKPKIIKRKNIDWKNPYNEPTFEAGIHQSAAGFITRDLTNKHIGTVVHQLLQSIAIKSTGWWNSMAIENQTKLISKMLILVNHEKSTLNNSVLIIQETIKRVLNDKIGNWILAKHQYHRCEYAISVVIDNTASNFVIDRIFIDQDVLWIIDYKSSSPKPDQTLTEFLTGEKNKYRDQINRYVESLELSWNLPIKSALYFPRIAAWIEY